MRVYFEDLKQEVQREIVGELLAVLAEQEPDYQEKAQDIGLPPSEYLSEKVAHLINCHNFGVDMDF